MKPQKLAVMLLLSTASMHLAGSLLAAPANRITRTVDGSRTRALKGSVHRLATAQNDKGAVDPAMNMSYMMVMTKPSAAQQADLDQLLADQQNPSSPQFHKWLMPEEFGNRFGLSTADHSKIVAWLKAEGFTINQEARGRNWVAFSGTAGQVTKSLRTPIHRFEVDGQTHFANQAEISVPDALADVVDGVIGLHDFLPQSRVAKAVPLFTSNGTHYLVPEDFATIYNLSPLYDAGLDGTGVGIAVVGQSNVLLSDLQAFKKRYNLPANDPKFVPYSGIEPGFNGAQGEGNLDLEWASAIAPKAAITYVYGTSAFSAMISAVNANYAPIITVSYGGCEINYAQSAYRSVAQQANAQGITILASSGDSGAAGCDPQGSGLLAQRGQMVDFPAVMPEVTAVGGTQFFEDNAPFWATTNSVNLGSAITYIPEVPWNESGASGLLAGGGGISQFYARPAWQNGSGVAMDKARQVPDVSLTAAGHDGYFVTYLGQNFIFSGTSASAPSLAGVLALLNQNQVKKGYQAKPGLGNINPQLYRLAQSAPAAFHDIIYGDAIVKCGQGSPDCTTGTIGYAAGPGYDLATGLGSIDGFNFVTMWNTQTKGVSVTLSASNTKPTTNDMVTLTATVLAADGKGTPTGSVQFSVASTLPLGSATVAADGTASVTFPGYLIGTGNITAYAQYSGDAAYTSGGASMRIPFTAPTGVAGIVPSFPNTVWGNLPDAQGVSWQTTLGLRDVAGVASTLSGFTIDGKAQTVSQYFPNVNIIPNGSISSTFVLRNLPAPTTRTYGFSGVDATGQSWSRQVTVNYNPTPTGYEDIKISATPSVIVQDTTADTSCQWPVQLHLDNLGGSLNVITSLFNGQSSISSQTTKLFGTTRVDAYGSLTGTLCFGGITPPATQTIQYVSSLGISEQVTVTFAPPPVAPTKLTATPASLSLAAAVGAGKSAAATLAVGLADRTQQWTAAVYPANRTTSWLTVSQLAGTGPATLSLTANGAGFEPGVYRAMVVLQCVNAIPQSVTVPVMFVYGGSTTGTSISSVANAYSFQKSAASGMVLSIFGSNLANATSSQPPATSPVDYSTLGVIARVNGIDAPVLYASPTQLNIQIPYSAGAGPAVVGVDNKGQIAGFQFTISPSAPGLASDANGFVLPKSSAVVGTTATVYLTGAGEVSPALKTAYWPSATTAFGNYKPTLPLSVTVGGTPAFLQQYGLITGQIGTMQVNFTVPSSLAPGDYPVVVTVGDVASPAVKLTVTPPVPKP